MLQFSEVTDPVIIGVEFTYVGSNDEFANFTQTVAVGIDAVAGAHHDPWHVKVLTGTWCGEIADTHFECVDIQDPLSVRRIRCEEDSVGAQRAAFVKFV